MSDLPYSTFRFDVFELRPHERVLYREQVPTALGARAVDVLSVLVAAQGRLVSKAELLERVWPGLVVEENNLQVQISALRKQLGPQTIATVPGRGYRFCLTVHINLDNPEDQAPSPAPLPMTWDLAPPGTVPWMPSPPAAAGRPWAAADALATAAVAQTRPGLLPVTGGPLWGRDAELEALTPEPPAPLLTLVGPAGIGKTTFSLALARRWQAACSEPAIWVDLSTLTDALQVPQAILQALGLPAPASDPHQALAHALAAHELLLVIDNAEHLLEATARAVQAIVRGAPAMRLLVTSQLPLKVEGERIYRLAPLSLPPANAPEAEVLQHGAVALFVDEVRALHRPFQLDSDALARVVRLCQRLDGMPLAIKLAAARVPVLGLQGVEERLDERFKLLQGRAGHAPSRQQALLAALDWSHDLLSPNERAVFRRLAASSGSFSIELARHLAGDIGLDEWGVIDILADLVDRSLVMAEPGEWPRYRLLDSMRDYAGLKLVDAGEQHDTSRRHAQAMADRMGRAYEAYWREPDGLWLSQYGPDLDNVRRALDWSARHDAGLALRLAGASAPLFLLAGFMSESRRRCTPLRDIALRQGPTPDTARFWLELARAHWGIDMAAMQTLGEQALAIYRQGRDARGVYMALRCVAGSTVQPEAEAWLQLREMATLEQPGWPTRLATQRHLAEISVLMASDRMADARRVCQTLLVRAQSAGLEGLARSALRDAANASLAMGDLDAALDNCRALLAGARSRRDPFVIHAQAMVGCIAIVRRDLDAARRALTELVAASAVRGWDWLDRYTPLLALLAALEGRMEAAGRLLGRARHVQLSGVSDVLGVYALSRATALVQDALSPDDVAQLATAGHDMPGETVAAWALGQPLPASAWPPQA